MLTEHELEPLVRFAGSNYDLKRADMNVYMVVATINMAHILRSRTHEF